MKLFASLVLLVLILIAPAQARPHRQAAVPANAGSFCWEPSACAVTTGVGQFFTQGPESGAAGPKKRGHRPRILAAGGQIVGHPPGCPARAFCGCGAAVRVFGAPRRDLYLAANWLRFPRAAPAPGMVAARRGHVFVLEAHLSGNVWMAYDANSGGHATRIHPRSLSGYTVVNPRA